MSAGHTGMAGKIETPRVVLEARARLGEGPCWDAQARAPVLGRHLQPSRPRVRPGHRIRSFLRRRRSRRLPGTGQRRPPDPRSAAPSRLARHPHRCRYPDPRVRDALPRPLQRRQVRWRGRFWFGTMSTAGPEASLYRYDRDGSLQVMETGLTVSNGLGWSPGWRDVLSHRFARAGHLRLRLRAGERPARQSPHPGRPARPGILSRWADSRPRRMPLVGDVGWLVRHPLRRRGPGDAAGADAGAATDLLRIRRPGPCDALHHDRGRGPRARTRSSAASTPATCSRWMLRSRASRQTDASG